MMLLVLVVPLATAYAPSNWRFEGRFVYAPAIVKAPKDLPEGVDALSIFGWTLGGYVVLEYDTSPADTYFEVVDMGCLCAKNGALGQWGRQLFVSTQPAKDACVENWRVPATLTRVDVDQDGPTSLTRQTSGFEVQGWRRVSLGSNGRRIATPVLWTPEITALWAPLRLPADTRRKSLRLHDLSISATSLGLVPFHLQNRDSEASASGFRPLGFALAADGLRIDIAPFEDKL